MESSVTFLISLTILLTLATALREKSHDMWLVKFDKPELNPEWYTNISYKLKKINKQGKALNLNVTQLQDIDGDDIMCQAKVFVKSAGKYVTAPLDLPEKPCCEMIKGDETFWPCIQESSNLPKICPIPKGVIELKDFNPDACSYAEHLPPNQPEDFKIMFTGTIKPKPIWKYVIYFILKKRMGTVF